MPRKKKAEEAGKQEKFEESLFEENESTIKEVGEAEEDSGLEEDIEEMPSGVTSDFSEFSEQPQSVELEAPVLQSSSFRAEAPEESLEEQMQSVPSRTVDADKSKEFGAVYNVPQYGPGLYEEGVDYDTAERQRIDLRKDREELIMAPMLPLHAHAPAPVAEESREINLRRWQQEHLEEQAEARERDYEITGKAAKKEKRRRGFIREEES